MKFRVYDLMCAPSLVGEFDTLAEAKRFAREYNEECEGDWFPLFKKLENGRWVRKDYKF